MLTVISVMKLARELWSDSLRESCEGAVDMLMHATMAIEKEHGSDAAWGFLCDSGGSYALLIMVLADAACAIQLSCSLEMADMIQNDSRLQSLFLSKRLDRKEDLESILGSVTDEKCRERLKAVIRLIGISNSLEDRTVDRSEIFDILPLSQEIWMRLRSTMRFSEFFTFAMPWEGVAKRIEKKLVLSEPLTTLQVGQA